MLKRALHRLGSARRGSVAVEFALVTTFLLLPLMGAGADFAEILSAQSQLNTTLQSLYYFAYSNPGQAANTSELSTVVADINKYATHQVSFNTNTGVTISYDCIDANSTITQAGASAPTCTSTQTLQEFATYAVSASVGLTVYVPGMGTTQGGAFPLSAAGQVEVQ